MNRIQWETTVPFFKNRFILKSIAMAAGFPVAGMILLVAVLTREDVFGADAKYFFGIIGILFGLTAMLLLAIYVGKYAPGFILTEEGIINYTVKSKAKKNEVINLLLLLFGFSKNAGMSSEIDMITQSRLVMKIKWKNIRKVQYYPRQYTIVVKGGFSEKMAVFCNSSNYIAVSRWIREEFETQSKIKKQPGRE